MIFSLQNITIIRQGQALLNGFSAALPAGGNLLATGASGSGKTLLLQALAGKVFYQGKVDFKEGEKTIQPKIVFVEQHYYFKNKSNTSGSFYYQQRFNSADAADAETVEEALVKQPQYEAAKAAELLYNFGMEPLQNATLLQLSSGEHKRFQIIKALLNQPEVLLLDEPYIGLDMASRKYLNEVLNNLAENGCTIIMVSAVQDAPKCITHVLRLEKGNIEFFGTRNNYLEDKNGDAMRRFQPSHHYNVAAGYQTQLSHFSIAVAMQNVTIRYGEKTILHNINWQVAAGEKWLLKGHNGAGKSTLISLITGDNPQAFANDIVLFDRKKGSGESIWDIKKNIGYISPEMQWHFDTGTTCWQAVGSGWFDTMGLFRKMSKAQEEAVQYWLAQFELEAFTNKLLRSLPVSKQKLALLARAMVKNPPMLILDEPCQGLDDQQKEHFLQIVEAVCTQNRTLIYVSHYAHEIPACIENVIELDKGEARIYRLTPTPLLTERDKAERSEDFILEIKKQEPAVTNY